LLPSPPGTAYYLIRPVGEPNIRWKKVSAGLSTDTSYVLAYLVTVERFRNIRPYPLRDERRSNWASGVRQYLSQRGTLFLSYPPLLVPIFPTPHLGDRTLPHPHPPSFPPIASLPHTALSDSRPDSDGPCRLCCACSHPIGTYCRYSSTNPTFPGFGSLQISILGVSPGPWSAYKHFCGHLATPLLTV
jgi:hypothetical protein